MDWLNFKILYTDAFSRLGSFMIDLMLNSLLKKVDPHCLLKHTNSHPTHKNLRLLNISLMANLLMLIN
jgi:hypothetical protein